MIKRKPVKTANRETVGLRRLVSGILAGMLAASFLCAPVSAEELPLEDYGYDYDCFLPSEEEWANEAAGAGLLEEESDPEILMTDGWDESLYQLDEEGAVNAGGSGEAAAGKALYFIPHQDDDLLTFAGGIMKDLQDGREVYVVLCTDGRSSKVFEAINRDLRKKKKSPLTISGFIAARDREFRGSLQALGVPASNIIIPGDRLVDGTTSIQMDRLTALIMRYVDRYPGAAVRANMPVTSEAAVHTDHGDIGIAVADLVNDGQISEALFFMDSYKYEGYLNNGLPVMTAYPEDFRTEWSVVERVRFNSAVQAYRYGSEYGIGYRSSANLFNKLLEDPHSYCYAYHPDGVVRFGGNQRYQTAQNAADGTTLEGISKANFMSPACLAAGEDLAPEAMEGKTASCPDSEGILVYNNAVVAPHCGAGTDPEQKGSPDQPGGTLVIAYGGNFPDALAAASLDCEIMLTKTASLSPEARAEILRTLPGRIVVMGSGGVVSENVVQAIRTLGQTVTPDELARYRGNAETAAVAGGVSDSYGAETVNSAGVLSLVYSPEIIRCGGNNRYETALEVVRRLGFHSTTGTAIITTGKNYADAVSIAPYAARTGSPILLASKGDLTPAGYDLLRSLGDSCSQVLLVGASGVVSETCRRNLEEMGKTVIRLSGNDRYETSAAVAEYSLSSGIGLSMNFVSLAVGTNFPDALIAGPITANNGSVLLLCHNEAKKWSRGLRLIAAHKDEIASSGYRLALFGSEGVVSRATKEFALCAMS